ncbi:Histidine kinase [Sulfidibacter corallicola]|uniref:histidine kinase n=1 Tax=Sulfidibacter corallicola TaxID=2818388 RepID=A0A8A4TLV5_SULCO|nr:ATP-binding protein [Sulfidibacter corallicola]QTD49858.1 HAMP domain-containing protein [Sulfidibacter corallicola]
MNARVQFHIYLVCVHLVFALSLALVLPANRPAFFILEGCFLLSLWVGTRLVRRMLAPLRFLETGAEMLEEGQFATRMRAMGQPELDHLIQVYNRMVESLHDERLRLGEQRGFLEKLLQATPAAIMTFDFDNRISMVNPSMAKLLECPTKDLLGRGLEAIDHPLARSLASLPEEASVVLNHRGGRRLKTSKSRFLDRGFKRRFLIIEEVTHEVRQSEKSAYEKLIRVMSHEVNNTIAAATSLLQSCAGYSHHLPEGERDDFSAAITVVIERMENLNRFMREYANMVRLPDPRKAGADLAALVDDIALLVRHECQARNITWRREQSEAPLPAVRIDRHLMEQALVNIVVNAIEAIGEDGTLTVVLENRGGKAVLCIRDSGQALTEEVRANLFSPFFTTKEDGHGIGLTLVGEILTRHGFDFALDGGPGRDTEFTIHFT